MNSQRINRLTEEILANGLDGVALMPGPNMVYFTGIHTHVSERPILLFIPADDDPAIIIPELEVSKAKSAGIHTDRIFEWNDDEGFAGSFQKACAQLELADYLLGVESLHMRVLELELLHRYAPGLSTAHADSLISSLRSVKDESEIDTMQQANLVAETAFSNLIPNISIGRSEKEIASMLIQELTEAGGEGLAFNPIVSAGPNGASPHAVPSKRPIREGDLLVIDWGVIVDDYPSDITRTLAVGDISPELRQVYDVVRQANASAKQIAAPGKTGQDLDRAARSVIEAAGYGEYFLHRTGHGLGLEVHEAPYIMEANTEPLVPGNVFTIEPGIYLEGKGGVRIEDDIVITSDGSASLTTFSRDLIQVG